MANAAPSPPPPTRALVGSNHGLSWLENKYRWRWRQSIEKTQMCKRFSCHQEQLLELQNTIVAEFIFLPGEASFQGCPKLVKVDYVRNKFGGTLGLVD
ncbi:hypothetical protein Sjap_003591 [Stephania japonica]|uniref:Uncharacterized protein n=1 Tax=Stephania japonica TaxID=461633 RepID=A0AAP0KP28_9MAGN